MYYYHKRNFSSEAFEGKFYYTLFFIEPRLKLSIFYFYILLDIMITLMTRYLDVTALRPTVQRMPFLLAVTLIQPMEAILLEP